MRPGLADAILRVELPTLGHVLEEGFCGPRIVPIGRVARMCGPARTVHLVVPDALAVNAAVLALEPGDVLVVRVESGVHAPIGAVTHAAALARGAAGIVVDGPVTDVLALEAAAATLPVWATGITARTTKRLGARASLDVPVQVGDAIARHGDVVAADEHGVLVVPQHVLTDELLEGAAAVDAAEPALLERIAAGEPLERLLATTIDLQEDA